MRSMRLAFHILVASTVVLSACAGTKTTTDDDSQGTGEGGGSGGGGGGTLSSLSDAAPLLAVASPVASRAGSPSLHQASRAPVASGTPTQSAPSLPDQIAAIKDRLAQTTVESCLAGISFQIQSGGSVSCYGPTIGFLNHPDVTRQSQSPQEGGGCLVNTGYNNDGCLPGGDLGLWEATADSGEACTAAKMNAQVMSVSTTVNTAVTLMAGLICVAQVNGEELTAGGDAVDLASVLTENLEGTEFTTASLERLADRADGSASYRIQVEGTMSQGTLLVTAVHSPGDDTGNGAAGLLHGYFLRSDGMIQQSIRYAFSVLYQVADGKMRYEVRSGNTDASVPEDDLFDDDGTFSFTNQIERTGAGVGGGDYERAEIDSTTGLGALIHAWQAGSGDSFTRVFHAATQVDEAGGVDTGFGYFGFGPPLNDDEIGALAGMFCNWAGPGNVGKEWKGDDTVFNSPKVQSQTMERDTTSGLFVPVDNYITYAPTNSCDSNADSGFVYQTGDPTTTELQALVPVDVTNDLVLYGAIGTMPEITPPEPYLVNP